MIRIQENKLALRNALSLLWVFLFIVSCNNKTPKDNSYDYVHIEPELEVSKAISSLIGEWRLDSVVFVNNNVRGNQQIPFSTTTWSFSDKGEYTVKIQQNQYDIAMVEDSVERKTSFTAEIPSSTMKGRYQHSNQELITNILGGKTKYIIVKQSDEQLQLSSQRMQVPPIRKADEGKLAEHYFTIIQNEK